MIVIHNRNALEYQLEFPAYQQGVYESDSSANVYRVRSVSDILNIDSKADAPVLLSVEGGVVTRHSVSQDGTDLAPVWNLLNSVLNDLGLTMWSDVSWSQSKRLCSLTLWEIVKIILDACADASQGTSGIPLETTKIKPFNTRDFGVKVYGPELDATQKYYLQHFLADQYYRPSDGPIEVTHYKRNFKIGGDFVNLNSMSILAFTLVALDGSQSVSLGGWRVPSHTNTGGNSVDAWVEDVQIKNGKLSVKLRAKQFWTEWFVNNKSEEWSETAEISYPEIGEAPFWSGGFYIRASFLSSSYGMGTLLPGSNPIGTGSDNVALHDGALRPTEPILNRSYFLNIGTSSSQYSPGAVYTLNNADIESNAVTRYLQSFSEFPGKEVFLSVSGLGWPENRVEHASAKVVDSDKTGRAVEVTAVTSFAIDGYFDHVDTEIDDYIKLYDGFNTTQVMSLAFDPVRIKSAFTKAVCYDESLRQYAHAMANAIVAEVVAAVITGATDQVYIDGELQMELPYGISPDIQIMGMYTYPEITLGEFKPDLPEDFPFRDTRITEVVEMINDGEVLPSEVLAVVDESQIPVTLRNICTGWNGQERAKWLLTIIRDISVTTYMDQFESWLSAASGTVADVLAVYDHVKESALAWFREMEEQVKDNLVARYAVHQALLTTEEDLDVAFGNVMDAAKSGTGFNDALASLKLAGDVLSYATPAGSIKLSILLAAKDIDALAPLVNDELYSNPALNEMEELDYVTSTGVSIVAAVNDINSPDGQVVSSGAGANIITPALIRTQLSFPGEADIPSTISTVYMPFKKSMLVLARNPVVSSKYWYAYWFPRFFGGTDYDAAQAYLDSYEEFKSVFLAASKGTGLDIKDVKFPELSMDGANLASALAANETDKKFKQAQQAANNTVAKGVTAVAAGLGVSYLSTLVGGYKITEGKYKGKKVPVGASAFGYSAGTGMIAAGSALTLAGVVAAMGSKDWVYNSYYDPNAVQFTTASVKSATMKIGPVSYTGTSVVDLMMAFIVWGVSQGAYKPINPSGPLGPITQRWCVGSFGPVSPRYAVISDYVDKSPLLLVAGAAVAGMTISSFLSYRKLPLARAKSFLPGVIGLGVAGLAVDGIVASGKAVAAVADKVEDYIDPQPTTKSNYAAILALAAAVATLGGGAISVARNGFNLLGIKSVKEQVEDLDIQATTGMPVFDSNTQIRG